jgi:hypothetical protein
MDKIMRLKQVIYWPKFMTTGGGGKRRGRRHITFHL